MTDTAPGFTERQLLVIGLLADGHDLATIGARLGITRAGAKHHADVIRRKLGVENVRLVPAAYRRQTGNDPFKIRLHRF